MSNRILAILILIWVIWGFYLLYLYFFVHYTSTLKIQSNVPEYTVVLYGKSVAKTNRYECPETTCMIEDISPIDYNITIAKDGYINFSENVDITPRSTQEIIINLQKKVELEKVELPEQAVEPITESAELTPQQKIEQIRAQKTYTRLIDIWDEKNIWVKQGSSNIMLYFIDGNNEKLIDSFSPLVKTIRAESVPQTEYIALFIEDKKYLWNQNTHTLSEFELVPKIQYMKQWHSPSELVFITDKGAFVYDTISWAFEYFYFFKDFVYIDGGYIGVIYNDETQKKENYGFEDEKENLIIRYIPETQQREIIYRTKLDVDRIYRVLCETETCEEGGIFFESQGERYRLENY